MFDSWFFIKDYYLYRFVESSRTKESEVSMNQLWRIMAIVAFDVPDTKKPDFSGFQ